jgi:hypothetical protein
MSKLLLSCLVVGVAWVIVETCGGLIFLAAGIRLWHYEILPLAWAITSPVVWVFAAMLIMPCCLAFDRRVTCRVSPKLRTPARLAFLMTAGPVIEVLFNEFLFRGLVGRPLYVYDMLTTFDGSGSLLSPLYYATLIIHAPVTDRLLAAKQGPQRSPSREQKSQIQAL